MTTQPPAPGLPEPPTADTANGTRWSPRLTDAAVVAAAGLLGALNSWLTVSNGFLTGASSAVSAGVSGAVALLLWWRRWYPVAVTCALLVAHVIAFTPTALAVALYTLGSLRRRHPGMLWAVGVAGCTADVVAIGGSGAQWSLREGFYSLAAVVGPLVVGYAVALRRDLAAAARTELAMVERWHRLLVEQARETERRRIAREMHDVVSHRVGHMVLTAGALEVARRPDPATVSRTAAMIRGEGRLALEELREVLGVLAPDRDRLGAAGPPTAAQPDAEHLPDLVMRAREAGQEVGYTVTGRQEGMPTLVQRAVYRAVQEGLTNAAKHAPGARVDVALDCGPDGTRLTVVNGPPGGPARTDLPGGGHGLVGLRERADLLGGTFDAGPYEGGFRLRMQLPHADAPRPQEH